jgi:hypothetical protein
MNGGNVTHVNRWRCLLVPGSIVLLLLLVFFLQCCVSIRCCLMEPVVVLFGCLASLWYFSDIGLDFCKMLLSMWLVVWVWRCPCVEDGQINCLDSFESSNP